MLFFYKSHLGGEMSVDNNPMAILYKPSVTDPVWLAVLSFFKPAQFQLSKAWFTPCPVGYKPAPVVWSGSGPSHHEWRAVGLAPGIRMAVSDVIFRRNWIFTGIQKSLGYTWLVLYFAFLGSPSLYWSKIDILLISWLAVPLTMKDSVLYVGIFPRRPRGNTWGLMMS